MLRYIKKYPLSLTFILLVIYLSFFRPPSVPDVEWEIPHLDKVVHMGMYFVLSAILWWEYRRGHQEDAKIRNVWIGAFLCPVLFSGCVELLQEYCTTYRGGDWLDFLANTMGALLASLFFQWRFFAKKESK